MISYEKFFAYLEKRHISQNNLIRRYGVSSSLLFRLRHNQNIRTGTLARICELIGCSPEEIVEDNIKDDPELQQIVRFAREKENYAY